MLHACRFAVTYHTHCKRDSQWIGGKCNVISNALPVMLILVSVYTSQYGA